MDNVIKKLITCVAVGFALAFPLSTKADACNTTETYTTEELLQTVHDTPEEEQIVAALVQSDENTPGTEESQQTEQIQNNINEQETEQQKSVEAVQEQTVIASAEFTRNTAPATAYIQDKQEESSAEAAEPAMQKSVITESEAANTNELSDQSDTITETDSSEDEETPPQPTVSMSVGGTTLGSTVDDSGWDGEKGWRYDGQNISMVNNETAVDVHAEGQGVELSAAGFNRIGTLYADGDVNITGTGILLIDNIDMLEGTKLNLLTNTEIYQDGTGSVAVFTKQDDGSYLLINGSVNGILDDTYSIPKDIHLVIPRDSSLDMRVLDCVKEIRTDEEGNILDQRVLHYGIEPDDEMRVGSESAVYNDGEIPYIYKTLLELTFPTLTIEEGASLTIEQDGVLTMGTTGYKKADADHVSKTATLTIKGVLELFGKIIGPSVYVAMGSDKVVEAAPSDLIPTIIVQENGSVQGSGAFSYVDIQYEGNVQAEASDADNSVESPSDAFAGGIHTGDNCRVVVRKACPTIYAEGKNLTIFYAADACIDGIVLADHGDVSARVYSFHPHDKLNLLSEPVDPGHRLDMVEADIFVNGSLYRGNIEEAQQSLCPNGWIFPVQTNTYFGGPGFFSALASQGSHGGKYYYFKMDSITPGTPLEFNAAMLKTINFSALQEVLDPQGELHAGFRVFYLKEYTDQSGAGETQAPLFKIDTAILNDKSTQEIPREAVCGIEMMLYELYATVAPASGSIITSQTNTGAGVLGGSSAGSLTGGAYTPILSGSRTPAGSGENSNTDAGTSAGTDTPTSGDNTGGTVPTNPVDTPAGSGGDSNTGAGTSAGTDKPTNGNNTGSTVPTNPADTPTGAGGNSNTGTGTSAGTDKPANGNNTGSTVPSKPTDKPTATDNTKDKQNVSESTRDKSDALNDTGAAAEDERTYLDVRVTGTGMHFRLSVYQGDDQVQMLNRGTVQVSFRTDLPNDWNADKLFAVFRNADGTMTAIKVHYDPATGIASFDTPILGEFDLICLDWEDGDYESDAFYSAVAELLSRNI